MVHARLLVCYGLVRDIAWRRKGSKCRRAKERKKRARGEKREIRVHRRCCRGWRGRKRDRGGEAQTGPGLVILRYHVLRITVLIRVCVCVQQCTYTHVHVHRQLQYCVCVCSRCTFLSPFFLLFLHSVLRVFLSHSFFYLSLCSLSLSRSRSIHKNTHTLFAAALLFAAET